MADDDVLIDAEDEGKLDNALETVTVKPRRPLSESELVVIGHLVDQGKSKAEIARILGRHQDTIKKVYHRQVQRNQVEGTLDEYVSLHLIGARVAAARGNTRPSEFMLERFEVVPKLHQVQTPESKTINVGIAMTLPGVTSTGPKAELPIVDVDVSNSEGKT